MNYQAEMDKQLSASLNQGIKPHVLLHVCCAPCSSACIERLLDRCRISVYYYNPNITEEKEYRLRAEEARRFVEDINNAQNTSGINAEKVTFIEGEYTPREWLHAVQGLEHEKEGGKRCEQCFQLRLQQAALMAEKIGADYYTTSLTLSPLKNTELINTIGEAISPRWLKSDFKKKGGYLRSIELSKQHQLYRQNYCGCIFSKRETQNREQKENKNDK